MGGGGFEGAFGGPAPDPVAVETGPSDAPPTPAPATGLPTHSADRGLPDDKFWASMRRGLKDEKVIVKELEAEGKTLEECWLALRWVANTMLRTRLPEEEADKRKLERLRMEWSLR